MNGQFHGDEPNDALGGTPDVAVRNSVRPGGLSAPSGRSANPSDPAFAGLSSEPGSAAEAAVSLHPGRSIPLVTRVPWTASWWSK